MKQLSVCALVLVGCVTSPLETSSTEQHEEIIVTIDQLPNCAMFDGYYLPVAIDGGWGCECIAFCDPPGRDPGIFPPGGGGGGGGGGKGGGGDGDDETKDDSQDEDPDECLSDCQTERNENTQECVVDYAYDACHYFFHNPDGTSIPWACQTRPDLPFCAHEFSECERAWRNGLHPNAVAKRQWCFGFMTDFMHETCSSGCFGGSAGTACDASIDGNTTVDDGTLTSDGMCQGADGHSTDCASPDSVQCQYGSDAED